MTGTQTEAELERHLIAQLAETGYEKVSIKNEKELLANFKKQLEKHNRVILENSELTSEEFDKVMMHLDSGSLFARARKLRDKYIIEREGRNIRLEFLNTKQWCQNLYQVTHQITVEGKYQNRYDVTLLINGLPLCQIELKKRGIELKEAFNQINRYKLHSYSGLFSFVQLFVISNGVNTKYYSNNKELSFKQTFYWSDEHNEKIEQLSEFAMTFLERCHLSKMISKYIVLNETNQCLMVLRPYQFFAVEKLLEKVKHNAHNGYIWHTTGSGKTLTSFKSAQLISEMAHVEKVVFVVDRKDLDYQTLKEFNSFEPNCVKDTKNTHSLVKQFKDSSRKMLITTFQKLVKAVGDGRFMSEISYFRDKKVVLIFDECHRSQFGEMHKKMTEFFQNAQLFGFTGTPIFSENANKFRTTEDLFGKCLHKYVIQDAILDNNVLGFSVEYLSKYTNRCNLDIEVNKIDEEELMNDPKRLEKIVNYILENHSRKTHKQEFNAIFAVSSIKALTEYYKLLKSRKHDLKITGIFTFQANEDMGDLEEEMETPHSRDALEMIIQDYNATFKTEYSTDSEGFRGYYIDVAKRVKNKEIDILLVVNMFLTGFDSKYINTLYVDKNLRYQGLVQAYSRTNRIFNEKKAFGNIACFRNLKEATDKAITLYSNKEALSTVLMKPYDEYVKEFNECVEMHLFKIAPTVHAVSQLQSEEEKLEFVESYRTLLRVMARLEVFSQFSFEDLKLDAQRYLDYRSKYLDIYHEITQPSGDKISILEDVDFEVELLHTDIINASYILQLLRDIDPNSKGYEEEVKFILKTLEAHPSMRSKKELIEAFIRKNLPEIKRQNKDIDEELEKFFELEKAKAIAEFSTHENIPADALKLVVSHYEFTGKSNDSVINSMVKERKFKEKTTLKKKIMEEVKKIVHKFNFFGGE